jgi:hypothetical protein
VAVPHRARPLALTAAFWLFPVGVAMVALAALLLVAQLAALPILLKVAQDGGQTIGGAVPLLGTGALAVVGAVVVVHSRASMRRHRLHLERRAQSLERRVAPETAGVSPGVAGTAHRRR